MKTSDFTFELPAAQIAQYPAKPGTSRLMVLDRTTKTRQHRIITDITTLLQGPEFRGKDNKPPLLVFNNTRVRKARLKAGHVFGLAGLESGEPMVEFLLLNRISPRIWRVMTRHSKRRKPGQRFRFQDGLEAEIISPEAAPPDPEPKDNAIRYLSFDFPIDDSWLDQYGHIPLPPYIRREDTQDDIRRYQTVYSNPQAAAGIGPGASSAAPTAGLHFTEEILDSLKDAGIESAFVTLHVGAGTFLPVRSENIEDHKMHQESFFIDNETAAAIENAKAGGRKILAVGTTSVRVLESAWKEDGPSRLEAGEGSTSIFIYPGYRFKAVDMLFTNFHTPESTLLMLVSAFAGREFILESYKEALREGYRFFSYGDACLIY